MAEPRAGRQGCEADGPEQVWSERLESLKGAVGEAVEERLAGLASGLREDHRGFKVHLEAMQEILGRLEQHAPTSRWLRRRCTARLHTMRRFPVSAGPKARANCRWRTSPARARRGDSDDSDAGDVAPHGASGDEGPGSPAPPAPPLPDWVMAPPPPAGHVGFFVPGIMAPRKLDAPPSLHEAPEFLQEGGAALPPPSPGRTAGGRSAPRGAGGGAGALQDPHEQNTFGSGARSACTGESEFSSESNASSPHGAGGNSVRVLLGKERTPSSWGAASARTLDKLDDMVTDRLFAAHGLAFAQSPAEGCAGEPSHEARRPHAGEGQGQVAPAWPPLVAGPAEVPQWAAPRCGVPSPRASGRSPQQSFGAAGSGTCSAELGASPAAKRDRPVFMKPEEAGMEDCASVVPRSILRSTLSNLSCGTASMDSLRTEHENKLVAKTAFLTPHCSEEEEEPVPAPLRGHAALTHLTLMVLCGFGVIPFRAGRCWRWYGRAVPAAVALLLLCSMALALKESSRLYAHLCTGCLALGSLVGLVSLHANHVQDLLGPQRRPLPMYAENFGFLAEWRRLSARRFRVVLALWACASLCKAAGSLGFGCTEAARPQWALETFLPIILFIVIHAVLAALIHCLLHVCSALELAIDNFCIRFFQAADFAKGISEWNILQALLRRSAHTVEVCFLALSTAVLGLLMLTALEMLRVGSDLEWLCVGLWAGWVLPPTALVFYAVFCAAAITEKCSRVPALVNSWLLEDKPIDHMRQYAVQHIMHSAAGFYVKGVRLNATWALKLSYLFLVLMFTTLTQTVLKP